MTRSELVEGLERADNARAQVQKLRQEVASEVNAAIETTVVAALQKSSVDDIRSYFPKGTRVAAMKGRYSTAADVYTSHPQAIAGLPGIGLISARAIHSAAKAKADEERSRVRFRLDPDNRPQRDTILFPKLQKQQSAEAMADDLQRLLTKVESEVEPIVEDAARCHRPFKMYFSVSKQGSG